jgi:pimeloyl-ACP methyl ester carboxylesterase
MATFVLVHGAWHGAWCWRDTAAAAPPPATRCSRRPTAASAALPSVGREHTLETHIRDVCGCIEWEELNDIVLVGHSYGGMVISGVADRMPERIRALVYLDAFLPQNGDSLNGLIQKALPPEVAAQFLAGFRGAAAEGHSGLMQPIPAEMFNVRADNRAWVDRRCRPQALATFEMPALLSGNLDKVATRLYILADGWDPSPFRHFAAQVDGKPGWRLVKMPSSHDVMVDMPKELAAELAKLA